VAALAGEEIALRLGLDALGDDRQAQLSARTTIMRAMAASLASVRMLRMKLWSIFNWSSGRRFR
jgi:hypothetical protein